MTGPPADAIHGFWTRTSCPLSPDIQHFSRKCQHPPTNILGRTFRPSWAFCVSKISLLLFLQLSTTRVSVTAMASYTHHLRTYVRRKVQQSLRLSPVPTLLQKKGTVKLVSVSRARTEAKQAYIGSFQQKRTTPLGVASIRVRGRQSFLRGF